MSSITQQLTDNRNIVARCTIKHSYNRRYLLNQARNGVVLHANELLRLGSQIGLIAGLDTDVKALNTKVTNCANDMRNLSNITATNIQQIRNTVNEQSQAQNQRIVDLTTKLNQEVGKNTQLSKRVQDLAKQNEALQKNLDASSLRTTRLENTVRELSETIAGLVTTQTLNQQNVNEKFRTLESRAEKLEQREISISKEVAAHEELHKNQVTKNKQIHDQIGTVTELLEQSSAKHAKELAVLSTHKAKQEDDNKQTKAWLERHDTSIQQWERNKQDVSASIAELQSAGKEQIQVNKQFIGEVASVKGGVQELIAKHENLSAQVSTHRENVELRNTQVGERLGALETKTEGLDKSNTAMLRTIAVHQAKHTQQDVNNTCAEERIKAVEDKTNAQETQHTALSARVLANEITQEEENKQSREKLSMQETNIRQLELNAQREFTSITALQKAHEEHVKENRQIKDDVQATKERVQELIAKHEKLSAKVSTHRKSQKEINKQSGERLGGLETKTENLEESKNAVLRTLAAHQEKHREHDASSKRAYDLIETLEDKTNVQQTQHIALSAKILANEIAQEEENKQSKEGLSKHKIEIRQLELNTQRADTSITELKTWRTNQAEVNTQVHGEFNGLNGRVQKLIAKHEKLSAKVSTHRKSQKETNKQSVERLGGLETKTEDLNESKNAMLKTLAVYQEKHIEHDANSTRAYQWIEIVEEKTNVQQNQHKELSAQFLANKIAQDSENSQKSAAIQQLESNNQKQKTKHAALSKIVVENKAAQEDKNGRIKKAFAGIRSRIEPLEVYRDEAIVADTKTQEKLEKQAIRQAQLSSSHQETRSRVKEIRDLFSKKLEEREIQSNQLQVEISRLDSMTADLQLKASRVIRQQEPAAPAARPSRISSRKS